MLFCLRNVKSYCHAFPHKKCTQCFWKARDLSLARQKRCHVWSIRSTSRCKRWMGANKYNVPFELFAFTFRALFIKTDENEKEKKKHALFDPKNSKNCVHKTCIYWPTKITRKNFDHQINLCTSIKCAEKFDAVFQCHLKIIREIRLNLRNDAWNCASLMHSW